MCLVQQEATHGTYKHTIDKLFPFRGIVNVIKGMHNIILAKAYQKYVQHDPFSFQTQIDHKLQNWQVIFLFLSKLISIFFTFDRTINVLGFSRYLSALLLNLFQLLIFEREFFLVLLKEIKTSQTEKNRSIQNSYRIITALPEIREVFKEKHVLKNWLQGTSHGS